MTPSQFQAGPGQVDFSAARWAPVINCLLYYHHRILLVKRSDQVSFYPGVWNGISGFLDDVRSLDQKVIDEVQEETGIRNDQIRSIKLGTIFHQDEPRYHKTWIVHPILVEVTTDQVKTDWEADEFRWVDPKQVKHLDVLPGLDRVLATFQLE